MHPHRASLQVCGLKPGVKYPILLAVGLVASLIFWSAAGGTKAACTTHGSPFQYEYQRAASANLTAYKAGLLQSMLDGFRPFNRADWDAFKTVTTCPPGKPMRRYGGDGDGGKILCSLDSLATKTGCVVYSLGSANNYKFEEAILKETPCHVHTFDCTVDGRSINPSRHTFHKWCIGTKNGYRTWCNITESLGHTHVDILKMDIEGFEYSVLAGLHTSDELPLQISMEFHTRLHDVNAALPATAAGLALVFMHLAELGYGAYSQEVNPMAPDWCSEFSFIRIA